MGLIFLCTQKIGFGIFLRYHFLESAAPPRPAQRGRWHAKASPKSQENHWETMFCDSADCVPETLIKPVENTHSDVIPAKSTPD